MNELLDTLDGLSWYLKLKHMELECVAVEKIIHMLTPEKVKWYHTNCHCPTCGRRVRIGNGSSSRTRDYRCQDCGQVLDWSDIDAKRWERWNDNGK